MRRVAIDLLRWITLSGLYLAFCGQISAAEIAAALLAGLLATLFSTLMRRMVDRTFNVRAPSRRIVAQAARSLMVDTLRVGAVLVRAPFARHNGRFVRELPAASPDGASTDGLSTAGRRATALLAASIAPNGYVIEAQRDALILHRLADVSRGSDRRGTR